MTPRTTRLAVAGLALVLGASALPATAAPDRPGGNDAHHLDLTLLATTDTHGRVANWDYFKDDVYQELSGDTVGLAKVASVVEEVRAEVGDEQLLVLDNGDAIQGTPLTYYFARIESILDTGEDHPMATAFNLIGYDAQVVGNHEFNYGLDLLGAYEDDLDAALLGANVVDAETGEPYLQPYTLIRKNVRGHKPVTVGVLGLTTPGSAIWDKGNVEGRVEFLDMVETAERYVPEMRAKGAEVVVVLSHAGIGDSSYDEGTGVPPENPTDVIAATVPDIDVIVVGHTHLDEPKQVITNEVTGEEVLLTQPYRWGGTVARVDLDLTKVRGRWDVTAADSAAIRTKDYPEHPAVMAAIADEHAATVEYVNQVVAESTETMTAETSFWQDTPIIDFIQHVQTETVSAALAGTEHADLPVLSIAAPFSRSAVFPEGPVTVRDIAGLYIYDNTLEAVELDGAQVKEYLEFSAKYFEQVTDGTFDPDTDVNAGGTPDYNYDILSGVEYDIDVSMPVGQRIENLRMPDGTPVGDDDRFVVAVNNYRRSGGGGFPHISTAPVVYNEQQEIRQLLIDWASERGVIDPAEFFVPNWQLTVADTPVG
jgi:2',3'-cyclic-nucleotide 2'-phosphodiesterase/3'-nucleotidase